MSSDGFFAWLDNGFETQWFAVGVLSCVRFAYRELTNGEPKKIKSHVSLVRSQGMGNSCFLWVHGQAHLS